MQLIIWRYIANPLLDWLPSTSRINKAYLNDGVYIECQLNKPYCKEWSCAITTFRGAPLYMDILRCAYHRFLMRIYKSLLALMLKGFFMY